MEAHSHPTLALLDRLVDDAVLSREDALQLTRRLEAEHVPLGTLLRERGLLTMRQLMNLLHLQAVEPLRIGELSVREGYCRPEDVADTLRAQAAASPHLFELVAGAPSCDRVRLFDFVLRYVSELEAQIDAASRESRKPAS